VKPVTVVVGLTYDDARQYVLTHMDNRPVLRDARLVSASVRGHAIQTLSVHRVIETPGARLGRYYGEVMPVLRRSAVMALR
jgi:hypothetical protein